MKNKLTYLLSHCGHDGCSSHHGSTFSASNVRVLSVERLENPLLWRSYAAKREALRSERAASGAPTAATERSRPIRCELADDELFCFHGTTPSKVDQIHRMGFDPSFAAPSSRYGRGVYFTDQSCKSHQYARSEEQPDGSRVFTLLYSRVLAGRAFAYDAELANNNGTFLTGMVKPVPSDPVFQQHFVDAGINAPAQVFDSIDVCSERTSQVHREIVVYDGAQAYPEFVVKYRLDSRANELALRERHQQIEVAKQRVAELAWDSDDVANWLSDKAHWEAEKVVKTMVKDFDWDSDDVAKWLSDKAHWEAEKVVKTMVEDFDWDSDDVAKWLSDEADWGAEKVVKTMVSDFNWCGDDAANWLSEAGWEAEDIVKTVVAETDWDSDDAVNWLSEAGCEAEDIVKTVVAETDWGCKGAANWLLGENWEAEKVIKVLVGEMSWDRVEAASWLQDQGLAAMAVVKMLAVKLGMWTCTEATSWLVGEREYAYSFEQARSTVRRIMRKREREEDEHALAFRRAFAESSVPRLPTQRSRPRRTTPVRAQ